MSFRKLPIAWQLTGLAGLGVISGVLAMMAVSLLGPPPGDPPHRLADIVWSLDPVHGARPHLLRQIEPGNVDGDGLPESLPLAREIAGRLMVPQSRVRFYAEPGQMRLDEVRGDYLVARHLPTGEWLIVRKGANRARWRWLETAGLATLVVVGAIAALSWLAARAIARPIEALGAAARNARNTAPLHLPDLTLASPEVRLAADAMADLQHRTLDDARQRVTMLAAIAHDVGTPLARLAFRAEELEDNQREAAMRDIAVIRRMLQDALTLSQTWNHLTERFDLAVLCREMGADQAATGAKVEMEAGDEAWIVGNPHAVQRMVQNLIDNALRYAGAARLCVRTVESMVELDVSDSGPGFPDMPAGELLRPFVRGEQSRNPQSGGSGLGLAIAAQVVEQHGGTITLGPSDSGGARVVVRLPAAPAQVRS